MKAQTLDASYPSTFDASTCARRGLCPVSRLNDPGSNAALEHHSLYYEQHGTGPERVIFISGLNVSSLAWVWQIQHFVQDPKYSVLVYDNCGVGNSDTPLGPYTTSGMAEDLITLLDFIGWKESRALHIVGVSFGGMIAQELATRIPDRIASLLLAATSSGGWPWANFPPLRGVLSIAGVALTSDNETKISHILEGGFPREWLETKAEDDKRDSTNREVVAQLYRDILERSRPQSFVGQLFQMAAALTHNVPPFRLRAISENIPKVLILTGDGDQLVRPSRSVHLKECMPEAEFVQWESTGHGLHTQHNRRFNEVLERVFEEGRVRSNGERLPWREGDSQV
ncbi:Alpha/Beta hydrolase protein [Irpex rosettiformis]|uniref:Alpha/Beta hydrolase protein n=1 Tax=Irpex rosettiformis TaxID=378272 RepID=A0ACB8TM67_9APHY|nr:Alpha/Beta hydrolase protein [Irpex rosettiformis]